MRTIHQWLAVGTLAALASAPAAATEFTLFEWAINLNGTVATGAAPPGVSMSGFDTATGLGTIKVTVSGAGPQYVALFVDHEIDEAQNTFFNEFGAAHGSADARQTWEIDEPGYVFGDIVDHLAAGTLDNGNGVPDTAADDVSMALGWAFTLAADETAVLTFSVGTQPPGGGFYLTQTDPDSGASVHFSSALAILGGGQNIPEPASAPLLGLGLMGLWLHRRGRPAAG